MPDASFAGQQETFLNVRGFEAVMIAIKHVYASLFNDRAISYRVHQGYDHRGVALSAGIQRMVRSDIASSGVMFSIDTESGFEDVVFVTSSYGLGEMVVQGAVNPDEFYVHKPTLAKDKPAVVRRNIGSKAIKMIYTDAQEHGKQVEIVDIEQAQSDKFSLTDNEVYAITAYLLSVNGIKANGEEIDDEFVLSNENFMDVKMNNPDGFYPVHQDRNDLKEQRGPLAQGERCMKDCKQPEPMSINAEIDVGFDPAISTVKSLPKVEETATVSKAAQAYEVSCSACHANAAIGAPVLGDKEAWAEVVKKGVDTVYANAINGINAMPPKGGADISDQELKSIVDYMINASK